MEINNETLYHVGTNPLGVDYLDSKEEHLFSTEIDNLRYLGVKDLRLDHVSDHFGEIGWLKFLDKVHKERETLNLNSTNWKDGFLDEVSERSYRLNARYWELIFETVRKEIDHNLPSRFNCIYLCNDKNDVDYWYNKGIEQLKVESFPVYKVLASGQILHVDSKWLELDVIPDEEIKEVARKYWSSDVTDKGRLDEYLFWGKISILEKFSCLEDVNYS